jgi:hypothetical protein
LGRQFVPFRNDDMGYRVRILDVVAKVWWDLKSINVKVAP